MLQDRVVANPGNSDIRKSRRGPPFRKTITSTWKVCPLDILPRRRTTVTCLVAENSRHVLCPCSVSVSNYRDARGHRLSTIVRAAALQSDTKHSALASVALPCSPFLVSSVPHSPPCMPCLVCRSCSTSESPVAARSPRSHPVRSSSSSCRTRSWPASRTG